MFRANFTNGNVEFNIKESFGPFISENLLILTTCKVGRILLIIEKFSIYGISPDRGEVLFEAKDENYDIINVIGMIEGCLLCIDSKGKFKLIEIFYETGQILTTWHLNFGDGNEKWSLEHAAIHKPTSSSVKFNLILKMRSENIGRVILVYSIDPQSEIVKCVFRHWIINNNYNDKTLPFIVITQMMYVCRLFLLL